MPALLSDRKDADEYLKDEIGRKSAPWYISASSVEIREAAFPEALQDAMSRQAPAEHEKPKHVKTCKKMHTHMSATEHIG